MYDDSSSRETQGPQEDQAGSQYPVALAYRAAGRSVLPIAPGEKRPSILNTHGEVIGIPWDTYQTILPDEATIRAWFPPARLMGIGIACGPASGMVLDNVTYALEVLDIDDEQTLDTFMEAANFQGLSELLQRVLHQWTPGGAGHYAYLCQVWAGNTKLAQRQDGVDAKGKPTIVTLIETRGAGGQAVVAPTPPGIHPEHPERGYELVRGSWEHVPIITPEERQALFDLARSFNAYVEPSQVHRARGAGRPSTNGNRPGDWLNRTADLAWWRALLERQDWTLVHQRGDLQYWQRPGKEGKAWSATLGACGPYFYVFSSNATPFQPEHAYSPFSASALLNHAGDFQAAARALIPPRFAEEWPTAAVVIVPLLEQLLATPKARLAFEALPELAALDRETWGAVKHAVKGLLGNAIDLNTLHKEWKKVRRRPRATTQAGTVEDHFTSPSADQYALEKPVIHITTNMKAVVDAGETAIRTLPHAPLLFQRTRQLCLIGHPPKAPHGLKRPPGAPAIVIAPSAHVLELASTAADWRKYDKREDDWTEAIPPTWFVPLLEARGRWTFPVLEGIVETPTLRPDGTILDTPGYDEATGLYFAPGEIVFPKVPDNPTKADVQAAIQALQHVFTDFPFKESYHRSAALAAVLTLLARYAIHGPVPLFAVRAPLRGSGKTLLVDVFSSIATHRWATRWTPTADEEEERKRLLTLALAGDQLFLIDNVSHPLGSEPLDAALTARSISGRLLGTNTKVDVPFHAVCFATGNNMQFQGDTARRVLPIDLDPHMEQPEQRTDFAHEDLLSWVCQERPRLVVAALTLLRAYVVAGAPKQNIPQYGSFEAWSALVRSVLVWAGEPDPNLGRLTIEAESDPEYERLRDMLQAWHQCFGKEHLTLNAAVQRIAWHTSDEPASNPDEEPPPPTPWQALKMALRAFDTRHNGQALDPTRLGYVFRKHAGRIVEGLKLTREETPHHSQHGDARDEDHKARTKKTKAGAVWYVEIVSTITPPTPPGGNGNNLQKHRHPDNNSNINGLTTKVTMGDDQSYSKSENPNLINSESEHHDSNSGFITDVFLEPECYPSSPSSPSSPTEATHTGVQAASTAPPAPIPPAVGEWVWLLSTDGVQQNITPYQVQAIAPGADGRLYARFAETATGWPVVQCERTPPPAPIPIASPPPEAPPPRPDPGGAQACPQCGRPLSTVVGGKGVFCRNEACRYRALVVS